MKIRNGFVSNSSTSSFCIYGCAVESYMVKKILVKNGIITQEEADDEEETDLIYETAQKVGMDSHRPPGWDDMFFGFSMGSIPDDVVVGEWKKEKEKILKKFFGDDIKCEIYQEAYPD